MRKILFLSVFLSTSIICFGVICHSLWAGTYNFYFYDKESDKNPEEIKEEIKKEEETTLKLGEEEKIEEKIEERETLQKVKTSQNYFSFGWAYETYYPKGMAGDMMGANYVLVRTQFIPWITVEGAIPITAYQPSFNVYRFGALIEFSLWRALSAHLASGILLNSEEHLNISNSTGYVGAGLKLRAFNHWDLALSGYAVPKKSYGGWRYPHIYGDAMASIGATYVF